MPGRETILIGANDLENLLINLGEKTNGLGHQFERGRELARSLIFLFPRNTVIMLPLNPIPLPSVYPPHPSPVDWILYLPVAMLPEVVHLFTLLSSLRTPPSRE